MDLLVFEFNNFENVFVYKLNGIILKVDDMGVEGYSGVWFNDREY